MTPIDARRDALRHSEIFRALDDAALEALLARASMRALARGELLLRAGDPAESLFVLLQGRLLVGGASDEGRETALDVIGPGQVLGEIAIIDGQPRSADVSALEPAVVMAIGRQYFLEALRRDPDLALRIMAVLCARLRRANATVAGIATQDLRTRLLAALHRLAHEFGAPVAGGRRLALRLSQKDLAALVGASREQVNRELKALESEGFLLRDGGHWLVKNWGSGAVTPKACYSHDGASGVQGQSPWPPKATP